MRRNPRALPTAAVTLGLLAWFPALAVQLPAGNSSFQLPGTTLADAPGLAGPVIARTQTQFDVRMTFVDPYDSEGDGDFATYYQTHAVLDAWVVRAQDSSLDFYWQLTNDARSEAYFDVVEVLSFGTAAGAYNVDWRRDMPGTRYPSVGSGIDADGTRSIGFTFSDEYVRDANGNPVDNRLNPGDMSSVFFVDTDARAYDRSATVYVMSLTSGSNWLGGVSQPLATFAPAVPEPDTWALMMAGGAALGWVLRRRRRDAAAPRPSGDGHAGGSNASSPASSSTVTPSA